MKNEKNHFLFYIKCCVKEKSNFKIMDHIDNAYSSIHGKKYQLF